MRHLIDIQYDRNDMTLCAGKFRVRGDTLEIFPAYEDIALRVEFFGDEVERIVEVDPLTGELLVERHEVDIYPAKHFVTTEDKLARRSRYRTGAGRAAAGARERGQAAGGARLRQRTMYDIEMLQETGYCSGVENYSAPVPPQAGRAAVDAPGLLP